MYEELNETIKRAILGNSLDCEKLLKELYPLIITSIKRYYNKSTEFEDLIQEGRVLILECIKTYDEAKGTYFLGYVKTMLRYHYLDKHKQKNMISLNDKVGNEEEDEEFIDLLISNVEDTLDVLVRLEENDRLSQALNSLTLRQKEIVVDFYYEGISIEEIGRKYGIAYRTVVNTKTNALNKLKIILEDRYGDNEKNN